MGFPWGLNAGWNASALHKSIVDSRVDGMSNRELNIFRKSRLAMPDCCGLR
jgi:hypothetical protein